jgi:hypothetical protein
MGCKEKRVGKGLGRGYREDKESMKEKNGLGKSSGGLRRIRVVEREHQYRVSKRSTGRM